MMVICAVSEGIILTLYTTTKVYSPKACKAADRRGRLIYCIIREADSILPEDARR